MFFPVCPLFYLYICLSGCLVICFFFAYLNLPLFVIYFASWTFFILNILYSNVFCSIVWILRWTLDSDSEKLKNLTISTWPNSQDYYQDPQLCSQENNISKNKVFYPLRKHLGVYTAMLFPICTLPICKYVFSRSDFYIKTENIAK